MDSFFNEKSSWQSRDYILKCNAAFLMIDSEGIVSLGMLDRCWAALNEW